MISSEIVERIIELRQSEAPFFLIAQVINKEFGLKGNESCTRETVEASYRLETEDRILAKTDEEYHDEDAYEEEAPADRFRREFSDRWDSRKAAAKTPTSPTKRRRVAVMGDWHGNPNPDALQAVIDADPDEIILAGDLLNCEQASAHNDDAEHLGRLMKDEIGTSRGGVQILSEETTALIKLLHGNHDKWLRRALKAAGLEWILDVYGEPLELMVRDIPRTEVVKTETMFHLPDGSANLFAKTQFMLPMGDAVISHLNFTSKHPGGAVLKLSDWMYEWHRVLGLPEPVLLVQLHVHKTADLDKQSGHLRLIEPGMAGEPSDEWYKMGYQPKWSPGSLGVLIFEQFVEDGNWKTDRKSIDLIRIGR